MDPTLVLFLTTFGVTVLVISMFALRERKIALHLKTHLENLGLSNLRIFWARIGIVIKGIWNGMPVRLSIRPPYGESQIRFMEIKMEIDLQFPGNFYLRNRARPLIYDWRHRPLSRWTLPKEVSFSNQQDNSLFAANAKEPELVDRLLNSVASRKEIVRNVIDSDGELLLEGNKLKAVRLTRTNLKAKDPASVQQIEQIIREQWDLLRTVTAILKPLELHVSDRSAAQLGCPYCKNELNELTTLVQCSSCRTYHHQTCFMENGRCSVYGCAGFAVPVLKSAPVSQTE